MTGKGGFSGGSGNPFAAWWGRFFASIGWPIARGPRILRAPIELRYSGYPSAGGQLQASDTLLLPSGVRVPAQNGGWWYGKELGGGDIEPRFSPYYRWRRFFPKMLFLAPDNPISPNPEEYDIAARPFAYASVPFDGPAQIPDGPTY